MTAFQLTDAASVDTSGWPALAAPAWGLAVAEAFGGTFVLVEADDARSRWLIPILRGGELARNGFVCGHLGCGGVFDARSGVAAPIRVQVSTLISLAAWLGSTCDRLVTPVLPEHAPVGERWKAYLCPSTVLELGGKDLWSTYSGSVRTALRRAWRQDGMRTGLLTSADAEACIELLHATQARLGAAYRTPPALLKSMLDLASRGWALCVGAWLDECLVSVGFYVRNGRQAAYVFNGWSDGHRDVSPNYPQLDTALHLLRMARVDRVDLGFSHGDGLASSKLRWGGEVRSFLRIPGSALSNPTTKYAESIAG